MLDVVFSRCPVGNATELAVRKGWLQNTLSEMDARFVLLQSMDKEYHSAHYEQIPPLHFRDGGNIPPVWAQSHGDRSVLLGVSYQNEARGIYVRPDSPIQSVGDLKGKRIAIDVRPDAVIDFRYLTAMRGIESAVNYYGFGLENLILEKINCQNIVTRKTDGLSTLRSSEDFLTEDFEAVIDGKADAVFAHSIKAVRHDKAGILRNIMTPEDQKDIPNLNNNAILAITCTKPFAYEHPEIVIAYLKEIIKAAEYIKGNHEDFLESSADGIYGATPEEMAASFENEQLFSRYPELSDKGLSLMDKQKEFQIKMGTINKENDFDILKWSDPAFLKKAYDEISEIKEH